MIQVHPAKKRRMPFNTRAHASKIRAVSRKSFSSLAMSFGKTPGRVKQITLTKLDKLMRSNTNRILRGVRWTLLPAGAWTTRTIISLFSSWSTWWAPGSSLALDTTKGPQCTFGNLKIMKNNYPWAGSWPSTKKKEKNKNPNDLIKPHNSVLVLFYLEGLGATVGSP